jgi:OHCU decarboxylase
MAPDLPELVDPATLGELSRDALAAALRPLLEDAGPFVHRLAGRSFPTWAAVLDAASAEVAAMGAAERAELLLAHPRIGASPDALKARSADSFAEQGGTTVTDPAVTRRLDELNDAYEARFGFPFVEWVAGRSKAAIVAVLEARLQRDRETELAAGCNALLAIAEDRLSRRVKG